ncbi:MAG: serine/threonine-protein kinase [Polyangiales bacterium]
MDPETRKLMEEAHRAEQRGDLDGAVRGYLRAELPDEAARILAGSQRYAQAGAVLLKSLGTPTERLSTLDAAGRQRARAAAQHLARGADALGAAEVYAGLGEHARGVDVLERAGDTANARSLRAAMQQRAPWHPPRAEGDAVQRAAALEAKRRYDDAMRAYEVARRPADAARMAVALGHWVKAGEFYLAAANPYDASKCFAQCNDSERCLSALLMVPAEHPGYRKSVVRAVSLAAARGQVDFALDRFVAPFLATRLESADEREAMYALARMYQAGGQTATARAAYQRVSDADPAFRDVAQRLAQLRSGAPPSAADAIGTGELPPPGARISMPEARMSLPQPLEEFPDLPPLPVAPPPAPPAPAAPEALAATRPLEAPEASVRPGDVINGRYRVEAIIGQGGMSTVFRAQDLELDEPVAIKLFGLDVEDPQMVMRFKQEVSLSRQLTHPNIVRLHDLGLWSGRRFITMELLEGQALNDWMRGEVPLSTGLRVMVQACTALGVAHAAGVVHRDVKPDNFFVTRAGIVKLMDFGIAKRRADASKTQAGFTAGTPAYIAPEQISDFTGATHLADLYALGVMMFELFTGRVPFEHEELMALLMAHVKQPPPSPASLRPDLPADLDALILQLLEKDPANRPARADVVVQRMRAILAAVTARD